jgi:formylglycine-generating enzyme required for sulfatase activity
MSIPDKSNMILVPAGEFIMGDDRFERERPQRTVWVDDFFIDRYLVTNSEFKKFLSESGYPTPTHWKGGTFTPGHDDHPAEVNWEQADAYASHVGKRLPTEAEWEKAARGTDGRIFPWGDQFDSQRSLTWETAAVTGAHSEPVTARPDGASPYGCEQMIGLCEEWCADDYEAYVESGYRSVGYGKGMKVLRGGSWIFPVTHARASYRCFESSDLATDGFALLGGPGFRCVADA